MKDARIHIRAGEDTLCGAALVGHDSLVDAALASNCDACRGLAGVGGVNERLWDGKVIGVRPEPVWEPKPMKNADEICARVGRVRRNGVKPAMA